MRVKYLTIRNQWLLAWVKRRSIFRWRTYKLAANINACADYKRSHLKKMFTQLAFGRCRKRSKNGYKLDKNWSTIHYKASTTGNNLLCSAGCTIDSQKVIQNVWHKSRTGKHPARWGNEHREELGHNDTVWQWASNDNMNSIYRSTWTNVSIPEIHTSPSGNPLLVPILTLILLEKRSLKRTFSQVHLRAPCWQRCMVFRLFL